MPARRWTTSLSIEITDSAPLLQEQFNARFECGGFARKRASTVARGGAFELRPHLRQRRTNALLPRSFGNEPLAACNAQNTDHDTKRKRPKPTGSGIRQFLGLRGILGGHCGVPLVCLHRLAPWGAERLGGRPFRHAGGDGRGVGLARRRRQDAGANTRAAARIRHVAQRAGVARRRTRHVRLGCHHYRGHGNRFGADRWSDLDGRVHFGRNGVRGDERAPSALGLGSDRYRHVAVSAVRLCGALLRRSALAVLGSNSESDPAFRGRRPARADCGHCSARSEFGLPLGCRHAAGVRAAAAQPPAGQLATAGLRRGALRDGVVARLGRLLQHVKVGAARGGRRHDGGDRVRVACATRRQDGFTLSLRRLRRRVDDRLCRHTRRLSPTSRVGQTTRRNRAS